jgi:hypothetical protein
MGTAIVVATILIAVFVPDRWPWRFARAAEPDPGTWAHDTTRVFAAVEHDPPPHGYTSPYAGDQIDVAAPLRLEGVTPNYTVQQVRVESGLTFSDGQTFTSTSTQVHSVKRESEAPSPAVARLQAVLGPVRLLSAFDPVSEISMPVLLTLGRTSYERYGREAGRLTSTLDFYLLRTTLVGSLPVRAGAVLRVDKRWFMVVRLPPADQCCRILLRWFDTPPLLSPDADWNSYMFVLRNQRRGEAIVLKAEWVPAIKSVQFGSSAFGTIEKSERLVQSTLLHWEPIDREWLADADIAVVQTRYVGHVTRPLTVERFIMNAEN